MVERPARLLAVLAAACPYPWRQEFNPLQPPEKATHTKTHGAKLMGCHTSFRHKQNATHRNLATKKRKKKKPELKQEQGKKRGNRSNDRHYLQGSVLFQRNKILRHAGSFDTLCLLTFQRGDAEAHDNETLNQSNHSVFHWLPSTQTKTSLQREEK